MALTLDDILEILREIKDREFSYMEFNDEFYLKYHDQMDEYDEISVDFLGYVSEIFEYTDDEIDDLTPEDRQWGYIAMAEFREWLRIAYQTYLDGEWDDRKAFEIRDKVLVANGTYVPPPTCNPDPPKPFLSLAGLWQRIGKS